MAYFSTLLNGIQTEVWFARDEAKIAFLDIGRDSLLPKKYMLLVEMYPTNDGTEFAFAIVEQYYESISMRPIFDSGEANEIIPKSYRAQILKNLLSITEKLVRQMDAPSFFMVTFVDHLPVKALEKYTTLCDIFEKCGYKITRTEPEPGKHFWFMLRDIPAEAADSA